MTDREFERLLLLDAIGSVMGAASVSRDLFAPGSDEANPSAWMLFEGIRRKCEQTLERVRSGTAGGAGQ